MFNSDNFLTFSEELRKTQLKILKFQKVKPEAEFKEFEPRLKFKPRSKYGWFYLKLYAIFQNLSQSSIETGFWGFETRLTFIKFGLWSLDI